MFRKVGRDLNFSPVQVPLLSLELCLGRTGAKARADRSSEEGGVRRELPPVLTVSHALVPQACVTTMQLSGGIENLRMHMFPFPPGSAVLV